MKRYILGRGLALFAGAQCAEVFARPRDLLHPCASVSPSRCVCAPTVCVCVWCLSVRDVCVPRAACRSVLKRDRGRRACDCAASRSPVPSEDARRRPLGRQPDTRQPTTGLPHAGTNHGKQPTHSLHRPGQARRIVRQPRTCTSAANACAGCLRSTRGRAGAPHGGVAEHPRAKQEVQ